ncbi:hypothetical protein ACFPM0_09415 [Pseudonocardia sulfidoxydans]
MSGDSRYSDYRHSRAVVGPRTRAPMPACSRTTRVDPIRAGRGG